MTIRIKRAYEAAARSDGARVLVDRLWPRGVTRDQLRLAAWARELAPSDALRRWYGHEPARFAEFARRYAQELRSGPGMEALADLARRAAHGTVTLVYATREGEHSNAAVLRDILEDALRDQA